MVRERLRIRWYQLWRRTGACGSPDEVFDLLVKLYSERGRAYHNLNHILAGLEELDRVRHLAVSPDQIEWAYFLHDAIYYTGPSNGSMIGAEEASAVLSLVLATRAGLSDLFARTTYAHILATKPAALPHMPDAKLLVDIDLAIFGKSEALFDQYELQIRREYQWVPETRYRTGRSGILAGFLPPHRLSIYSTGYFKERYEMQARRNITRSLSRLAA